MKIYATHRRLMYTLYKYLENGNILYKDIKMH